MIRRDLFKKQSDPLIKTLDRLLEKLNQTHPTHTPLFLWDDLGRFLEEEKGISLPSLLQDKEIAQTLTEKGWDLDHLSYLADTLYALAEKFEHHPVPTQKELHATCLRLYGYLQDHDTVFSLGRHSRIEKLKMHDG